MTSEQINSWVGELYNGYELAFKLRRNDDNELKAGVCVYETKLFGLVRWGTPLFVEFGHIWYESPDDINEQIDRLSDKAKRFIETVETVERENQ